VKCKRCLMECLGTFFLMYAIAFSGDPFAIGFVLMAMIYVGAPVSGAHYNPILTMSAWLRGAINMCDALCYMASQTVGAFLAVCLFSFLTGSLFGLEQSMGGAPLLVMALPELLQSFILCMIFLVVTILFSKDNIGSIFCITSDMIPKAF